ncbi:MAG: ATP-binding protein [Zavarzinia sp.]|nr:ATP-binding protein [Zavarzinia sp.]
MRVEIEMGTQAKGLPAQLDLEELLATRLLVQGNSGSGKSHLLRRLLEQSATHVQQAVIDPEGDFVTLADEYGHVVVEATRSEDDLTRIAARARQHRVSVVLSLEGLDAEAQMRAAAAFLGGLFDAERDYWYPMLVVVDEAQLFAPAAAGDVSDEARKLSLGAMANLMSRGRKRGLAGVIATQRLAKLAKNVAAEASNFLMGRTFLDIDMARAGDLLGMDRRQTEMFRDLERGHFVALGPAVSRVPLPIRIGPVVTSSRSTSPVLVPLPEQPPEDAAGLIFTPGADEPRVFRPAPRAPTPSPTADIMLELARSRPASLGAPPPVEEPDDGLSEEERQQAHQEIMRDILGDPDAAYRTHAILYQDFLVRCRIRKLTGAPPELPAFRRLLAMVRAGIDPDAGDDSASARAIEMAARLTEDLQGIFLLVAQAAVAGRPCPGDAAVARAYGTQSLGRARRLLAYLEECGLIVMRTDFRGQRVIAVPDLGVETAPGDAAAPAPVTA